MPAFRASLSSRLKNSWYPSSSRIHVTVHIWF
jgi:hypothetical protein